MPMNPETWPAPEPAPAADESQRLAYHLFRAVVAPHTPAAAYQEADALAARAQAGDLAARDQLYARLEPTLARLAAPAMRWTRALPGAWLSPDDLRQQTFLAFCDLLRAWQPARAPFEVYLGVALPYRLRRFVRRADVPRRWEAPFDVEEGDPPDPAAPDPADAYHGRAACAALLAVLEPIDRRIVAAHAIDGVPLVEVAAALGVSQRTARRRYAAALRALRALLVP
jgi:RNA polymerase sigma factor (sigma-70 family)